MLKAEANSTRNIVTTALGLFPYTSQEHPVEYYMQNNTVLLCTSSIADVARCKEHKIYFARNSPEDSGKKHTGATAQNFSSHLIQPRIKRRCKESKNP